ncbi:MULTISPECIES: lysozyme inhibitor LprI family protein [Stenotrophomonas]|uniref:lysozyme inhibitor LprI family protein n=1 Tax=Stenotrophomonas TaxID=40323 RepID=UPI0024DE15A3|nr:lysozyme inhibitor LprI family protein [Stenotrophomonas sp. BIO128-Bstrain]WIA60915.1 lysozyme inhibitor LprI family protein [Stenotrophomonas sp. BIO128-Bstrain]
MKKILWGVLFVVLAGCQQGRAIRLDLMAMEFRSECFGAGATTKCVAMRVKYNVAATQLMLDRLEDEFAKIPEPDPQAYAAARQALQRVIDRNEQDRPGWWRRILMNNIEVTYGLAAGQFLVTPNELSELAAVAAENEKRRRKVAAIDSLPVEAAAPEVSDVAFHADAAATTEGFDLDSESADPRDAPAEPEAIERIAVQAAPADETGYAGMMARMAREAEQATARPSFDCARASHPAEHLLCSDASLAAMDVRMARAYADAPACGTDRAALRADQRQWLQHQRNQCSDAACLEDAYQARIAQLEQYCTG